MEISKAHIPDMPPNYFILRIFQMALASVTLGLSAYAVAIVAFDGDVLSLVTALFTVIISIYIRIANRSPQAYNYWAILALEIFLVIFWLISFALLASEVAFLNVYYRYTIYVSVKAYLNIISAIAALGALSFVCWLVDLVFMSVMIHRHRQKGGHCTIGATPGRPAQNPGQIEMGAPPVGAIYTPQAGYPNQPTYPTQTPAYPNQYQYQNQAGYPNQQFQQYHQAS